MIDRSVEAQLRAGVTATTVGQLLDEAAGRAPDDLAVVFPGRRLTFAQLAERVESLAYALLAEGVAAGDHVALLLPNDVELVVAVLALAKLGAVSVPVSTRFKDDEVAFVLADAGATLTIDAAFLERADGFATPTDRAVLAARAAAVAPADVATILYTSGTTARPKGCLLTHRAFVWQALRYRWGFGLTPADRYWIPLALFHVGGLVGLHACLAAGAAFVHPGHFEAGAALEQLEAERCTTAAPVFETIWLRVLRHERFAETDLSALRAVLNIGAPERLRVMAELLPGAIALNGCGSTELCGQLGLSRPDDPPEVREVFSALMPGVEVRILDPETGADLPPHEPGELLVRGPGLFSGYHGDPELTARVIDADGWVRTGDRCLVDGEGRISYVGRLKDMLKVGGENVAPTEVEDFLARHEAVEIVSVVGVRDARYDEVPAAFVQLRAGFDATTERDVIDFCVGRMATFKVPRYVRFVTEWPMSGTKIVKHALRDRLEAELDAAGIAEAPRVTSLTNQSVGR